MEWSVDKQPNKYMVRTLDGKLIIHKNAIDSGTEHKSD